MCAALLALALPAAGSANHVGIDAAVGARVVERSPAGSWVLEVTYTARCTGAGAKGASYTGNLNLVDERTGKKTYLGGTAAASGTTRVSVAPEAVWRRLRPELRISCWDNDTLHGSGVVVVAGGAAVVPSRDGEEGTAGGGGGGADDGGGDPTKPPASGGCVVPLVGTEGADTLVGTGAGDVVFGRGGNDVLRGRGGHDCLLGSAGRDTLRGEEGNDRLTGGSGADTLVGGPGANVYDAGAGDDVVDAVNGRPELVACGPGTDRARVDRRDRVTGCERVTRAAR